MYNHYIFRRANLIYSNTSTVSLRVVEGDGKGTQCPGGITGPPCSWVGYKYVDLAIQVGGVSNLRQSNVVTSPAGLRPENDCAGEDQQQL
jgi:hypothetical protein